MTTLRRWTADRWAETLIAWCAHESLDTEALLGDLWEARESRRASGAGSLEVQLEFWWAVFTSAFVLLRDRTRHAWDGTTSGSTKRRGTRQREHDMKTLWTDLRFGINSLRRARSFTVTAVVTLALGIAGVTLMFSLAETIMLRELPIPAVEQVMLVGDQLRDGEAGNTGYATFDDWRARNRTFESMAIVRAWVPTLLQDGEATRLVGARMSWEGLPMLGARALHGRIFEEAEDDPERRRVVVLSHRLWQERFDADPDVIGRGIDLAGTEYRVLGVLSADYQPVMTQHLYSEPEIFAPLGYRSEFDWACRSCRHLKVFGRLRAGETARSAQNDLQVIQADLSARFPEDYSHGGIAVLPLRDALTAEAKPVLRALAFAVGALLLVACANVSLLQMARTRSRRNDLTVRVAIGASSRRLLQLVLVESSILWALGASLGVATAVATLPLVARVVPAEMSLVDALTLNPGVLVGSLLATFAATLSCGLMPALGALHLARRGVTLVNRWATAPSLGRRVLVTANVALAFALVVGSGLMLNTVARLMERGPGFDTDDLLTAKLSLLGPRYEDDSAALAAFDRLVESLESEADVARVALASQVPLTGDFDGRGVDVEGRVTGRAEDDVGLQRYSVTDGYLEAMGIPLLQGRGLGAEDTAGAPKVVLVSESAVPELAPKGGDVLGTRIRFGGRDDWWEVVGVVGDVRHEELGGRVLPAVYQSQRQWTDRFVTLVAKTEGRQADRTVYDAMSAVVRAQVPDVPIYDFARLEHLALESAARQRFTSTVLAAFAAAALFLACVGLYGVIAFLVEQRRREIGLRLALGAMRRQVAEFVFRQGMLLVLCGIALGGLLAGLGAHALGTMLFETDPYEPGVYLRTLGVLLLVGLVAHAAPLVRALRVDPSDELRRT